MYQTNPNFSAILQNLRVKGSHRQHKNNFLPNVRLSSGAHLSQSPKRRAWHSPLAFRSTPSSPLGHQRRPYSDLQNFLLPPAHMPPGTHFPPHCSPVLPMDRVQLRAHFQKVFPWYPENVIHLHPFLQSFKIYLSPHSHTSHIFQLARINVCDLCGS